MNKEDNYNFTNSLSISKKSSRIDSELNNSHNSFDI